MHDVRDYYLRHLSPTEREMYHAIGSELPMPTAPGQLLGNAVWAHVEAEAARVLEDRRRITRLKIAYWRKARKQRAKQTAA